MTRQALQMDRNGAIRPLTSGGKEPGGYRRIVFLVHGFNNDSIEAGASFAAMRRGLNDVLVEAGCAEARRRAIQELIWEFHWPGFVQLPSINIARTRRTAADRVLSAAAYNLQVRKARDWVADRFKDYCVGLGDVELFFIAHSLGCRLVLETVERLASDRTARVRIGAFLLMAAAVPVDMLTRSGRLGSAVQTGARQYCFYSHRDAVLLMAFPAGQLLAGEAPLYILPVATGLTGWPKVWDRARNTGFGHGDYWSKALATAGIGEIEGVLAGMFAVTVARYLSASSLPSREPPLEDAYLPQWRIAERHLQGADWLGDLCDPA